MKTNIDKLTTIYLNKLQNNERLNISDLYPFSKINLKKRRNKKKFDKHYERYIREEVYKSYWGCLFAYPLVSSFKREIEFTLSNNIKPMDGLPNVELFYSDYKYKKEND